MSVRLDSGQMGVPVRPAAPSLELPSDTGLRLCSGGCRWQTADDLPLTATELSFQTASQERPTESSLELLIVSLAGAAGIFGNRIYVARSQLRAV